MLNSNLYYFIPFLMTFSTMIISLMSKFTHPLNLMILLIIYTLSISLFINFNSIFIYSYILFLIMIGGMMIMFLYFSSLINNEKSKTSNYTILSSLLIILSFILIILMKFNYLNKSFILINDMLNPMEIINSNYMFETENIYSYNLSEMTSFLIYFLFFSMIMVIKLCKKTNLPLRKLIYVQFFP
uniref:NADH dehydrogenase subunit 6 n=1 Tax=Diodontus minutus TaxID=1294192 RepID=A0A5J6DQE6_9HYME|nr:NADH dehydrogenase subunit 6 [Diodontus minutus]